MHTLNLSHLKGSKQKQRQNVGKKSQLSLGNCTQDPWLQPPVFQPLNCDNPQFPRPSHFTFIPMVAKARGPRFNSLATTEIFFHILHLFLFRPLKVRTIQSSLYEGSAISIQFFYEGSELPHIFFILFISHNYIIFKFLHL